MVKKQWFMGVLIMVFGVVLLLNNFKVTTIDIGTLVADYWPLFLIAWGISIAGDRRTSGDLLFGGLVIFIGGLLLGRNLELFAFDFSWFWASLWPLLIILIGLNILLGSRGEGKTNWAIMSGVDKTKASWKLENGNYLALMGGIDLDLRKATMEEGEYSLNCTALMGGIEIVVPRHIAVTCTGTAILGGVEFFGEGSGGLIGSLKTEQRAEQAKTTLHITCRAILGGVDVKES